jgi:hypothetical protein
MGSVGCLAEQDDTAFFSLLDEGVEVSRRTVQWNDSVAKYLRVGDHGEGML